MKKKLLSLFMACAMILALAVPAFATPYFEHSESDVSEDLTQSVTIATRTFVPTVKLTLPTLTEPSIVLNPYKISFTGEDDLLLNGYAVADSDEQGKQVISPVYTIKNQTNVKLNYTVAVTGTVEGGVTFSNDPVSVTEKNKKAHVALMVSNKGATADSIDNADSTPQEIVGFGGLTKDDIETMWLKTSEVKSSVAKSLEPGNSSANYVAFQFKGDLTRLATPNAWTADDKIGAVITFTFTPESKQDYEAATAADFGTFDQKDGTGLTAYDLSTISEIAGKFNATDAKWAVVNGGLYGAKIDSTDTSTPKKKITLDATTLNKLTAPAAGAASNAMPDTIVISFVDEDNIPRTVELPITVKIKKTP